MFGKLTKLGPVSERFPTPKRWFGGFKIVIFGRLRRQEILGLKWAISFVKSRFGPDFYRPPEAAEKLKLPNSEILENLQKKVIVSPRSWKSPKKKVIVLRDPGKSPKKGHRFRNGCPLIEISIEALDTQTDRQTHMEILDHLGLGPVYAWSRSARDSSMYLKQTVWPSYVRCRISQVSFSYCYGVGPNPLRV